MNCATRGRQERERPRGERGARLRLQPGLRFRLLELREQPRLLRHQEHLRAGAVVYPKCEKLSKLSKLIAFLATSLNTERDKKLKSRACASSSPGKFSRGPSLRDPRKTVEHARKNVQNCQFVGQLPQWILP